MAEDLQEELGRNIPLSEMIQTLRQELQVALSAGDGHPIKFDVDKVDLELRIALEKGKKGEAKVKFWVLSLGGGGEVGTTQTHVFKVSLKPKTTAGKTLAVNSNSDTEPT